MDDLDIKIIGILQRDGRASNARVARDVAVSEGTVRRRLQRLFQDKVISVVAVPDPEILGYATEALIGVQVDPDKIDSVAETLKTLQEASWVSITTGAYDVFMWVIIHSADELGTFLRTKVGPTPGVRRTETFVNLTLKKRDVGLPPIAK